MENQIIKEGVIYSLETTEAGEKIAQVVGHTSDLVGTIERHHPSPYSIIGGPCHIMFEHNGVEYGPLELPLILPDDFPVVKEGLIDISIPDEIGYGYKVTAIGDAALQGCYRISSIRLPKTLRFIDKYAFESCKNLIHVDLYSELKPFPTSSPFANTSLHYLTVHDKDSLNSAMHILEHLQFERNNNPYNNETYPDTEISEIVIANDAALPESDILEIAKRFNITKQK